MTPDLELDQALSAAISGIPKVAELITLISADDQRRALAAAEKSYLATARSLGCEDAEADQWVSEIMVRLRALVANTST